jgi:hypothetical protein
MDTGFSQPLRALGGEDIGAVAVTAAVVDVVVERAAGFVVQIDCALLAGFMADRDGASLGRDIESGYRGTNDARVF